LLKSRLLSFGLIAGLGFLLLVSLAASALLEGLGEKLADLLPGIGIWLIYALSQVFTLLVATVLFAAIFKVLPAAKITWREVWPGAIVTAVLFMIGRFLISFYISRSDFGSTYGAAGSLVVLLVWVYYSSLILYFGAEFTRAYAERFGTGIRPASYALAAIDRPATHENSAGKR
jgi:membrane protein